MEAKAKVGLCGACGSRPRQPDTRAAAGPALGALGPLCEELAGRTGANAGFRKRGPQPKNAAVERREARRARVMGPAISGDPEIDLSARQITGAALPHQRLSALCSPPSFEGSGNRRRGVRRPTTNRGRSVGCLTRESGL